MAKAVLDTTVLVSAFLNPNPGGAAFELLRFAKERRFELYVSGDILKEVANALTSHERMRRLYRYSNSSVVEFCQELGEFATLVRKVPEVHGIVARDPNDDMIVACALAASADYIVTRDKDLLSLRRH
jgi:putative PIN family toxin of toxin-antitoxin system